MAQRHCLSTIARHFYGCALRTDRYPPFTLVDLPDYHGSHPSEPSGTTPDPARPPAGDWVEHFGAGAGFWNVMRLDPDRDRDVVIMTDSTATYDFEPMFALLAGASWS